MIHQKPDSRQGDCWCTCSGVLKRTWAKAQLAFGSSPEWIRSLQKAAPMTFNTAGRQRASRWLTQNKDVLRSTSRGRARPWRLLRLQNSSEVRLWLLNLKTQQHLHGYLWWGVKDLLNLNKPVLGTQTETKRQWTCSQGHRSAYQLSMPSNKLLDYKQFNDSGTVQKDGFSSL